MAKSELGRGDFKGSANNKTTKQGYGLNSRPRKRGKKPYRGQGK